VKTPRDPPPTGKPQSADNWQAQHPPFYYALLTPAYLLYTAAKEWIGLVAYRLMGKTDALFPGQ
jgi:hypothetical protein